MHILVQAGLVALGSALGGVTRWGMGEVFAHWLGRAFPWGTLFINLSGSFFLGWFATMLAQRWVPTGLSWIRPDDLRLLVAVGFLGGYTTFSSFEQEADALLRGGEEWASLAYLIASVALGLIAVRVGSNLGRI